MMMKPGSLNDKEVSEDSLEIETSGRSSSQLSINSEQDDLTKVVEEMKNIPITNKAIATQNSKASKNDTQSKLTMTKINFAMLNTLKLFNQDEETDEDDEQVIEKLIEKKLPPESEILEKTANCEISDPDSVDGLNDIKNRVDAKVSYTGEVKTSQSTSVMNKKKLFTFIHLNGFFRILKNSRYFSYSFYKNNPSYLLVFVIWICLSIFFVVIQLTLIHPNIPLYVMFARSAAILIYFYTDLMVICVLRRTVTWLRNTRLGKMLNFIDETLEFHKALGIMVFILSFIHTLGQCINLYYLSDSYQGNFISVHSNRTNTTSIIDKSKGNYGQTLFLTHSGVGWIGAGAAPTGWILVVIMFVMYFFAMPFIRRRGYFQAFYYTHYLYYAYFIVFFFHASKFWQWFLPVLVLMIVEKFCNWYRVYNNAYGETYIKEVNLLSSQVTHLVITRPKGFKFQSGDYIFVKIPKIARNEWHPFTISSAPELKDELWLHVRSLGNWTGRLNEYFTEMSRKEEALNFYLNEGVQVGQDSSEAEEERLKNIEIYAKNTGLDNKKSAAIYARAKKLPKMEKKVSAMVIVTDFSENGDEKKAKNNDRQKIKKEVNLMSNTLNNVWVPIRLDGPYGTASGRIFDSEHAVLIAGGIGVTPFASILQSLWFHYVSAMKTCQKCEHTWYDKYERKNLKKVDFIWVNRDFDAFEWFVELLAELELQQTRHGNDERFLSIHLYMTSAKAEQYIKCSINPDDIKKINKNKYDEVHKDQNKDFCLRLTPGRPKFEMIFKKIREENNKKVDVFFCGAPAMAQEVRKTCKKFEFNYSQENF